jgi:hypothetical protein
VSRDDTMALIMFMFTLRDYRVKDARRFLDKYKRVDIAIDAYYSDPSAGGAAGRRTENPAPSTSKLNALFDKYRGEHLSTHVFEVASKRCVSR